MIALLQIRQDPVAFYSPTVKKNNQDYYLAGPVSGMAEELAELFMLPVRSGIRRGPIAPAEREEEEDDVEVGRRDERRASERFGQGAANITLDDDLGGFGGFGDDTGLELEPVEGLDDVAAGELARKRDASLAPSMAERFSRAGSVARSIIEARVEASGLSDDCPIAFFDTRLRVNGVPQAGGSQSQVSEDFRSTSTGQGWSRNTVMAVEYLKGELQNGEDEDASLSFNAAAKAVSRACLCLDPTRFVKDDIHPTVFKTRGIDNVFRATQLGDEGYGQAPARHGLRRYSDSGQAEAVRECCSGGE